MAPLAQAFVRLRPQLSEAEVRTQAARAGEQAGAAMGHSMSSGLTRAAKAFAGLGAATGLVEAGRKALEFADQFEGARSRVEQNTQNIGASFEAVQKPLGELDTKMSALGFTITDTENSFAQLVTATRDPAKSLRDVALAADIARGRHISLDAATQILMRVETGHVAMLGRLGIATRDASGHIFTQAQALDALATAYGGNASRFADTFAGKQAAARAEIQQSATQIGVALLPALNDLAGVMAHDVLPPIAAAARFFDRNRATIEPLVKVGLELTAMWKAYTLAAKLAEAMTKRVGDTAAVTSLRLVSEGAAGEKAAVGLTAEARAAAAGSRFGTAVGRYGPAALGAGAIIASGYTQGTASRVLGSAGTGALLGGMIGPEGALAGGALGALYGAVSGGGGQHDKLTKQATSGAEGYAKVQQYLADKQKQLNAVMQDGTNTTSGGIRKQIQLAQAALKAADAQKAAKTAAQQYVNALNAEQHSASATAQKLVATSAAQDGLREAMHQAAQTAADNGRRLSGNSDAALANRDAVRQQVSAVLGVVDAMKAQGRSAHAQASMLDVLTQAVETNATKIYGDKSAVDALLTSLGLVPGQAQAAASALDTYATKQLSADAALDPKHLAALSVMDAKAKNHAKKMVDTFTETFSPVVSKASETASKAADSAAKKAADAAKQRFNDLKQSMLGDLQSIKDAAKSTSDSLLGFASITNNIRGSDSLGAPMAGNVFANRKQQAAQLKQFAGLYERLSHAGLNATDLHQFMMAGPDAIPAMQQILAAGRGGVRQINALDRQDQAIAGRLGKEDAASQNASLIHSDLQKLPRRLALELDGVLRKLHIITDANGLDHRNGVIVAGAG